jgi:steroid delta-isomerase
VSTATPSTAAALEHYVAVMESLQPDGLARLVEAYAEEARFVDPFNEVRGLAAIRRVFAHGFTQCPGMRFRVTARAVDGDRGLLEWEMVCARADGEPLDITGMTRLRFVPDGRVVEHVDHWDPAGQLYERVPLLGWLLRRVRGRLSAG